MKTVKQQTILLITSLDSRNAPILGKLVTRKTSSLSAERHELFMHTREQTEAAVKACPILRTRKMTAYLIENEAEVRVWRGGCL
jgi:hypothetical protein